MFFLVNSSASELYTPKFQKTQKIWFENNLKY